MLSTHESIIKGPGFDSHPDILGLSHLPSFRQQLKSKIMYAISCKKYPKKFTLFKVEFAIRKSILK